MPDLNRFSDPGTRDGPLADRPFPRRVPARRSLLAGMAVESLVVIGLVTLIVAVVALQALGAFGPVVHEVSFLP
jgi:hypothetical protein